MTAAVDRRFVARRHVDYGRVRSAMCPASALQFHPDATIVLDEAAAGELQSTVLEGLKKYADQCFYLSKREDLFEVTRTQRKALQKQLRSIFRNEPSFAKELGVDDPAAFAVARDQRLHHGMFGLVGLQIADAVTLLTPARVQIAYGRDELAAAEPRVHVLHRPAKLGLGTAYLAGFKWGIERGYDALLEMDADFSHDPLHLPQFLSGLEQYDIVLGSRYLDGRVTVVNWPMPRLLLSYGANIYARIVTGLPLFDATGGFKAFRRKVLEAIPLDIVESEGYAFQIEMSMRAWKKGFRIGEIPIVFVDRTTGESKMSGNIIREAVWKVWKLRFLSVMGKL